MLAECRSPNITEYYASVMLPGTTELLIIMELMAGSVNDLVGPLFALLQDLPGARMWRCTLPPEDSKKDMMLFFCVLGIHFSHSPVRQP